MKIVSYTVELDEIFQPPVSGLAPENYNFDQHNCEIGPDEINTCFKSMGKPAWKTGFFYKLTKKIKKTSTYCIVTAFGGISRPYSSAPSAMAASTNSLKIAIIEKKFENGVCVDVVVTRL